MAAIVHDVDLCAKMLNECNAGWLNVSQSLSKRLCELNGHASQCAGCIAVVCGSCGRINLPFPPLYQDIAGV